jgi:alanine dehydrogenase
MKIGCVKEIKKDEYRVGLVPAGVYELVKNGHEVFIERGTGEGSGISDEDYKLAGGRLVDKREDIFDSCRMIIKVKEPLEDEFKLITKDHIVFTYFHFAAARSLTDAMLESNSICIAYETMERLDGSLPLLIPMSEVAGRMSIQEGAKFLEKPMEGRGILLGGIPGVPPANVLVLGGGIVGLNAARVASGLGARVTIVDINVDRLRYLNDIMPPNVVTLFSNPYNVQDMIQLADLVVCAVLIPGARTPKLVPRKYLRLMKPGACIVDVSIDQGGCAETSKPTTHSKPSYIVDGVVHYCVTNIPGAVGRTSTYGLTNVSLPYAIEIANKGWLKASRENPVIKKGLNVVHGEIVHPKVAEAHDMPVGAIK